MGATSIKTIRKHIFLHPVDKKRRHAALKTALLKDKKKYSDRLEGALLDVKNLKVVGQRHLVVEGYISLEVEADFTVFCPQPGLILEGVINKQSYSHLGCLVLGIFNASLSIPSSRELIPQVGDVVSFVVTEVVVDGEIMFMRGSLESIIRQAEAPKPQPAASIKAEPSMSPVKHASVKIEPLENDTDDAEQIPPSGIVVKTENHSTDSESPSKSKKKKKKKSREK
ncbi:DNA-directed RNA polymerase I subunit RPA43 [Elysia marginata]|uniref:DNA-directed RNA polymerase I subunit RPA43 n=1 Tax=Elysia marginata TaxID=1093978 RepID=A0AAV4I254_9GAST|nr:DNA-directed RNA polymerase I subunit RPA43 [Elysia marginata]